MKRRRAKPPADAEQRLLMMAANSDFMWRFKLAAWRTRYGLTEAEVRERALQTAIAYNAWQPKHPVR